MKVYHSTLTMQGTGLNGENPLPMFRNRRHHQKVPDNGSLSETDKMYLGYETGERYLPYRMQDRYTRAKKTMVLKTIILENELLKAVILPEYGGRLYSLKDKSSDRELLYKNPVFQPANLAILNAWFSGGIEWNIGQLGHTFATCSPVHAAKLVDDEGNEFLRLFDYERCKNMFWHIDLHLPKGSEHLLVYVRMINDNKSSIPMYWWTNIAVEETNQSRVFSSTSEVIYNDPIIKGFSAERLPFLPMHSDMDASYPMQFPFANEYFFQTPEAFKSPWESVVYEDGRMFYERSTSLLRYRKMFCWGNHAGGRRWCDYLAKPGEGNYFEIQGGLSPTQLHGLDMPANAEWDFTQLFGASQVDTNLAYQQNWDDAREYIQEQMELNLQENQVYAHHDRLKTLADRSPEVMMHRGSGWGTLERLRREKHKERNVPKGFLFTEESIGAPQLPWLVLMQTGVFPESAVDDIPVSWMVQTEWMSLLQESLKTKANETWTSFMQYGVMLYEQSLEDEAIGAWEKSLAIQPSAWVYRNLAEVKKHRGEIDAALSYLEQAYRISNSFPDIAFAEEYLNLLIKCKQYKKAWQMYETLPAEFTKNDRIQIIIGEAALQLNKNTFLENLFVTEFALIREGELSIVRLWYKQKAQKLAKERDIELTKELMAEVIEKFPPPANIDFRMSV